MSWAVSTIGDVCVPTSQRNPATGSGDFRYIDIAGIDRDAKVIAAANAIPCNEAPSRARKEVKAGDVLVSTVRPNLNAVAQVPPELDGEIASTGFAVLRAKRKVVDARYLFYRVQHQEFVDSLVAYATGASYPAVSDAIVRRAPLPLPPPSEQRRIVEILDQVDALRKLRRDADAKAARILPALFLKMFGDPATNPMGWPTGTLGSFGIKTRYGLGQPPKTAADGLPLIRATNINAGHVSTKNLVYVDPSAIPRTRNAFLGANEVIVVRSGAYTGDAAQVTENWKGSVVGYDLVATPPDGWTGEFLEQFILTPFVQRGYFASQRTRAGQPHLNSTQLEATPAFAPDPAAQLAFAKAVQETRSIRDALSDAASSLEMLFSSMMQRAFSGQLTASWRQAHMQALLVEMQEQARLLNLPAPH